MTLILSARHLDLVTLVLTWASLVPGDCSTTEPHLNMITLEPLWPHPDLVTVVPIWMSPGPGDSGIFYASTTSGNYGPQLGLTWT